MNLKPEELAKLKKSKTQVEWDDTCDEIKEARGGEYPPDWFGEVHGSGLMSWASRLPLGNR